MVRLLPIGTRQTRTRGPLPLRTPGLQLLRDNPPRLKMARLILLRPPPLLLDRPHPPAPNGVPPLEEPNGEPPLEELLLEEPLLEEPLLEAPNGVPPLVALKALALDSRPRLPARPSP